MSSEEALQASGGPRAPDAMFEELVRLHRAELTRFAVRLLGEHAEQAEDVVQESLLNAHRALRGGTVPERPRAWLFTIVHNAAVNAARGVRSTEEIEEGLHATSDQSVPEAVEQGEWIDWLMTAVGQLPERQRDALVGHAFEGRSYRELAARQATTVPAVKSLIGRARRALSADASFPVAGIATPLLALARFLRAAPARSLLAGQSGATKGLAGVLAQAALTATVTTGVLMAVHGGSLGTGLAATGPPRWPAADQRRHTSTPHPSRRRPGRQTVRREGRRAIRECTHRGVAGARYSEAALQYAARHLTTGELEYTNCERQLELAAPARGAKGRGGTAGSGRSRARARRRPPGSSSARRRRGSRTSRAESDR